MWRDLAVRLRRGRTRPADPGAPVALTPVARWHAYCAATLALLAAIGAATVVVAFRWSAGRLVGGAVAGTGLWGAIEFLVVVRGDLPAGELAAAPPEAVTARLPARHAPWLVALVPLTVAFAWLADRWHVGGLFVPGQYAGYAAAHLAGALLARRWEREHGRRVLRGRDGDGDAVLYAAGPPAPA